MRSEDRDGRPKPQMTLPHSVSEVLREHVVLENESIDRMYLSVWVCGPARTEDRVRLSASALRSDGKSRHYACHALAGHEKRHHSCKTLPSSVTGRASTPGPKGNRSLPG